MITHKHDKKTIILILLLFIMAAMPSVLSAVEMSDYCSAPPFVSTTVPPNIMILLDNSCDMLNPAYDHRENYTNPAPGATPAIPYRTGYFIPTAYYYKPKLGGGTNMFEVVKMGVGDSEPYFRTNYLVSGVTTTYDVVFKGDFLNWMTMSRFDLLQKVLTGGNAAQSRSSNGNNTAVRSLSGDSCGGITPLWPWTDPNSGCSFDVVNGQFVVKDTTAGSCSILTALNIAQWPNDNRTFLARIQDIPRSISTAWFQARNFFVSTIEGITRLLAKALEWLDVPEKAYAAAYSVSISTTSPLPQGVKDQYYSKTLEAQAASGTAPYTYTWAKTSGTLPPGMNFSNSGVLSGTPTETNVYTFTVQVTATDSKSPTPRVTTTTKTFQITISAEPVYQVNITVSTLPNGRQGTPYSTILTAFAWGGTPDYTYDWLLINGTTLPPGLNICAGPEDCIVGADNYISGEIYGTPTALGTTSFTVQVTATDALGHTFSTNKELSITVTQPSTTIRDWSYELRINVGQDRYGNNLPLDNTYGIVQRFWESAHWGVTDFQQVGSTINVNVDRCLGANTLSTFLNTIDSAVPSNVENAPLSAAYYGIVKYFQYSSGCRGEDWHGSCGDPFQGDTVPCRKNFILTLSSAYDLAVSTRSAADTTALQDDCTAKLDENNQLTTIAALNQSRELVQRACYAYENDQRSPTVGATNVEGFQRINHYAVYTFGLPDDLISTAEGNGANREDNRGILEDSTWAGGGADAGKSQFYDAAVSGKSLASQLEQAILDILRRAASGTAVSVLTTSSRGVGSMIQAYFYPSKIDAGRSIDWLGYAQNVWIDPADNLREDTVNDAKLKLAQDKIMRLYFDETASETKAALFTTDANGNGGTLADCSASSYETRLFSSLQPLWESGKKLADVTATDDGAERKIFTAVPGGDGINAAFGVYFTVSNMGDSGTNTTLKDALSGDSVYTPTKIVRYVRGQGLGAADPDNFRDRRVTVDGELKVWKLGDVINSTPKVVSNTPQNTYFIDYGDSSYYNFVASDDYQRRSSLALIGGNDGMLHAFRVGYLKDRNLSSTDVAAGVKAFFKNLFTSDDDDSDEIGKEVWAYIPYNALPYLKYFATPGYCHIYFVDLSVKIVDVSWGGSENPDPDDERTAASWKTIVLGGMRLGGSCSGGTPAGPPTELIGSGGDDDGFCEKPNELGINEDCVTNAGYSSYFALDLTDPENPKPLWEFTDTDLGYTTSYPSVIRTGGRLVNGNWYVTFGSGSTQLPKSGTPPRDMSRDREGFLYILDLKTGSLVKKIGLGHDAIVSDILTIDANKDYHSEKVYFNTMYSNGGWAGKIMSLATPTTASMSDICGTGTIRQSAECGSALVTLFDNSYPFTASPDATKDSLGNIWVFAGSGKYYTEIDEADSSPQIFVGFKDLGSTIGADPARSSCPGTCPTDTLCDVTKCTTEGDVASAGTISACVFDTDPTSSTNGQFAMKPIVTTLGNTTSPPRSDKGWMIYLPRVDSSGDLCSDQDITDGICRSERVISRPLAVGGVVDFLSYKPDSDVCSHGGDSFLYAVDYMTGVAPASVAIRAMGATSGTSGRVTVNAKVKLGPGAPPTGEAIIIPPPKVGKEQLKKKIQVATGVIVETENKPTISTVSKIMHWLKK